MEATYVLLWLALAVPLFGIEQFDADSYNVQVLSEEYIIGRHRRSVQECHKPTTADIPSINYVIMSFIDAYRLGCNMLHIRVVVH